MIAPDVAYYPPRRGECLKGNRMPLLAELIEIPESVQRDDFVLKLTNGVSDEAAAKTLSSYVVTPELVGIRLDRSGTGRTRRSDFTHQFSNEVC